ncbi:hypothetical protein [Methylobacterium sp. WL9]|uniref:hypothetical protein n=1 Tax=Methylobacterium sp. WL9 TaxID=2603898 RepID=UPI0011CCC337|nr:hypothetical protein [Methylobacterium sp. WL9]TXN23200.1 hypothetical protein FV217_07800 [Methylobacterium sp. WL9]
MTMPQPVLFDEACARLPLFENLPADAPERLAAAGLGRGLLTATVRGRLRKAGFTDMGRMALATPAELTTVRKIGPIRLAAIRAHILAELAKMFPDARTFHAAETTAARRIDRLRSLPAERLPLSAAARTALGCACVGSLALALRGRRDCLKTNAVTAGELDEVVTAFVHALSHGRPRRALGTSPPEGEPTKDAAEALSARMLREREWEAAAPNILTDKA